MLIVTWLVALRANRTSVDRTAGLTTRSEVWSAPAVSPSGGPEQPLNVNLVAVVIWLRLSLVVEALLFTWYDHVPFQHSGTVTVAVCARPFSVTAHCWPEQVTVSKAPPGFLNRISSPTVAGMFVRQEIVIVNEDPFTCGAVFDTDVWRIPQTRMGRASEGCPPLSPLFMKK